MARIRHRRCGAVGLPDRTVHWTVWAPKAHRVDLVLIDQGRRQSLPMGRQERGFFTAERIEVPEGQRYAIRLGDGPERPDPCSLWQPQGVHGPSAVVRTSRFRWTDRDWQGVRRQDLVFYELHVGTFTPEGTFAAIIPRLDSLRELGVTALQLMPVGQFPGKRNWGYDGVHPYAAQDSYGGPRGLQELVDACHAHELAVFLDVVYNHLGPEGNYLSEFGPYFTDRYRTPWGMAFNYDGAASDPVRDYVLDNARMWLDEFHIDGLRLDAVHAIYDFGARHLLQAVKAVADEVAGLSGRRVHVAAESDLNDPRLLRPPERGGYGLDAQWSDDFHHAVHTVLTGEATGYYADFGRADQLSRVLEQPFLYAGAYSAFRDRKHGAPPEGISGDRFVVCLQNHDQVGNRPGGDRLGVILGDPAKQRLATSLLLLSPYLPLLFMGEEYGEDRPFPFFCSFGDPELVQAVREGRRREFADFTWEGGVPDPHDEGIFTAARLTWSWPEGTPRAGLRRLYRDLLAARRAWPALRDFENRSTRLLPSGVLEMIRGTASAADGLTVWFNLSGRPQSLTPDPAPGRDALFSSEAPAYGGQRNDRMARNRLLPHECMVGGPASWRTSW
jgi:maltooligosyltrehalose trehalohydrolase